MILHYYLLCLALLACLFASSSEKAAATTTATKKATTKVKATSKITTNSNDEIPQQQQKQQQKQRASAAGIDITFQSYNENITFKVNDCGSSSDSGGGLGTCGKAVFLDNSRTDPPTDLSILDFLNVLTSNRKNSDLTAWEAFFDKVKIPLFGLLSDGNFSINNNFGKNIKDLDISNDIVLLEEQPILRNFFCNKMYQSGFADDDTWVDNLCACENGNDAVVGVKVAIDEGYKYSNYCSRKPCIEVPGNECMFTVNPWRKSIVFVSNRNAYVDDITKFMTYTESIPKWTPWCQHMRNFIDKFKNLGGDMLDSFFPANNGNESDEDDMDITSSSFIFDSIIDILEWLRNNLLEYVPYYLGNFLLGNFLWAYSNDIAKNQFFQAILMGTLGVFLAIVLVIYLVYRVFEKIFISLSSGGGSGATSSIGAFFLTSSILYINNNKLEIIAGTIIRLWDNGITIGEYGGKWVFKVLYLFSFVFFAWLGHRYQIFVPTVDKTDDEVIDTLAFKVLLKCIVVLAMYLIYSGSSHHVLMAIYLFYLMLEEEIWDYYRVFSVSMSRFTSRGPEFYHGKRLTMDQYDRLGDVTTERELAKLKNKLANKPHKQAMLHNIYQERGSKFQSENLRMFMEGTYTGRAHRTSSYKNDQHDDDDSYFQGKKTSWFGRMKYVILLIAVVSYLYVYSVKNAEEGGVGGEGMEL